MSTYSEPSKMSLYSTARKVAAATVLALPLSAGALTINVEVSQVSGNLWHYDYFLSGEVFNAPSGAGPHGFTTLFDYTLYGPLSNPSTTNSAWDILVDDPDSTLFFDGIFDALAQSTPAGTGAAFGVDFVWLGTGTPTGIQPFEVYSCSDATCTGFSDLRTGTTAPVPTPLPATLLLMGAGVAGFALRRALRADDLRSTY